MDDLKYSYRFKAAAYRARAQTAQDKRVRAALEALALDYSRLAERSGYETALTVEFKVDDKGLNSDSVH